MQDQTFLTASPAIAVLRAIPTAVAANGFSPDDDAPNVVSQIAKMERYARMAKKTLVAEKFVGARRWYAYTARVFKVVPAYDAGSP